MFKMNLGCTFLSKMYYQSTTIDKKDLNKVMSTKVVDEMVVFKPFMRTLNFLSEKEDAEIIEINLYKIHKEKSEEYKLEIILQTSSKFNLKDKIDTYNMQLLVIDDKHVLVDESFKKSKCKITSGKKKNHYKITKEISSTVFMSCFNAFKNHFDNNSYTLFATEFNITKKEKERKDK